LGRIGNHGLALRREFLFARLELFPKACHVNPRLLGFYEDARTCLFLFADMMLDIFRQGFNLCAVIFTPCRRGKDIGDQDLGTIMFHLSFVQQIALDLLLAARGVKQFLFQLCVNDEFHTDLPSQSLLLGIVFALFELCE
jgi:hypothetical protein